MRKQEFQVDATIPTDPERVWALLGNSRSWPRWTPLSSVDILAAGDAAGVGERRRIRNGRHEFVERVVDRAPARRLQYTVESGLAVRDYCATVTLEPAGDGVTAIRWHTVFLPTRLGTGWMYRRAIERATQQFVAGLREHAPRTTLPINGGVRPADAA
jgi:uncharacterized protein YndB with AHSA1/START domain